MTLSKKAQAAKAKKAREAAQKQAAAEAEAATQTKVEETTGRKPGLYVAEGKAITSKKGILGPGDEVKEEYFPNEKTVKNLAESGHIEVVKG